MDAITFSEAARNFGAVVDLARAEPVHVTRTDGRDVIVINADDYSSMVETLRIYTSPENRVDLDRAIAAMKAGEGIAFDPTT